jgi:hypothetical protein
MESEKIGYHQRSSLTIISSLAAIASLLAVCLLAVLFSNNYANLKSEFDQDTFEMKQKVEDLEAKVQVYEKQDQKREKRDVYNNGYGWAGSTYVRWGRKTCPGPSQLVYEGFAGGQWYANPGGSSEKVCLPYEPEYGNYTTIHEGTNWISGAEYQTGAGLSADNIMPNSYHDYNVPCAVCYAPGRGAQLMIPAKRSCPDVSWTKEYEGYLMAENAGHASSTDYNCVDRNPELLEGTVLNTDGTLFYLVQGYCPSLLHCPPYIDGAELTCVVCTK